MIMKAEELKVRPFNSLVNVARLLKEPVGSSQSYQAKEIVNEPVSDSIEGELMLIHTSHGVLVRGELNFEVELQCSRCLNAFLHSMSFSIEEEFLLASSPDQSVDIAIDNNHMLDLGEIIRQYILLNLPMKSLCQPHCAGIKEITSHGST